MRVRSTYMNDSVRSASRVLDLLELLAGAEDGLSLAEACERLGAPKSSTLMLLRTLAGRGYAVRGDGDRYRLNETFRSGGFGWRSGEHPSELQSLMRLSYAVFCFK